MANAPCRILVLPRGQFQGRDGRGPYLADDLKIILRNTQNNLGQIDLPVDFNHAIEKRDGYAPAAGWIKKLDEQEDGLWANVEWTDKGKLAVESKEFRYISPAFVHDSKNKVLRLTSVALTNAPNLGELQALSTFAPEDLNSQELQRAETVLTLPVQTTEEQTMAEAEQTTQEVVMQETESALIQRIDKLEAKLDNLITSLTEKMEQIQTLLNRQQSAEEMVTVAQQQGKVTPAMVQWATDYARKDPDGFRVWMSATPEVVKTTPMSPPASNPLRTLTEEQAQVAEQLGYAPQTFAEHLAKQ